MGEKRSYPWIKSIFSKKRPVRCVYAGPEQMRNNPASGVYAGPDYFEKKRRRPEEVNDVYAGPEFFEKKSSEPEEVNDVYAGPEYFGEPEEPDTEMAEEPEETAAEIPEEEMKESEGKGEPEGEPETDTAEELPDKIRVELPPSPPVMLVYAGPGFFPGDERPDFPVVPPPQEMTMAVYAGPEFFNGPQGPERGMFVPAQTPDTNKDHNTSADSDPGEGFTFCPSCGNRMSNTAKFCCECGTINPVYGKDSGENDAQ